MLSLEAALQKILEALPAPVPEPVPVAGAHGRFLLESPHALVDVPPFDNSAFDGYAVRSADVTGAGADQPVELRVIGRVEAGACFQGEVSAGTCVRLFTGAALPSGADAIVMQEDTESVGPDRVRVRESVKPWEGVRFHGEDVRAGASLAAAGDRINAGLQALFAASGVSEMRVGRRPVVSLVATGSELCEAGAVLAPGKIYESNRPALVSLVRLTGAEPRTCPLAGDRLGQITAALKLAFSQSDAVLTCGGVSVGEADYVKEAFRSLGGEVMIWKVAIKPGKPFVFGRLGGKFLFGLPGNPVSAVVTFALLVRPALLRWQGAREIGLPEHPGRLAEPLSNRGERPHFARVAVGPDGAVRSAGLQASHALSSLAKADGLVRVPGGETLAAGATVRVLRFDQ